MSQWNRSGSGNGRTIIELAVMFLLISCSTFLSLNQTSGYVMTPAELSRHLSPWLLMQGCVWVRALSLFEDGAGFHLPSFGRL